MDKETARVLLSSFLDRVERSPDTGKRKLVGVISDQEWEALALALEALGGRRADAVPTASAAEREREMQAGAGGVELAICPDLKKASRCLTLTEVEAPDVTLCLDFGTAMSKAFAVRGDPNGDVALLDLGLGRRAGEAGMIYPVSSSLWIEEDGRIFFGREAVDRSVLYGSPGHLRFDSMKQHLSQGIAGNLDEIPLEESFNPSDVRFTVGQVITLYLAYLTDLAVTDLEERHRVARYVRRHFALPCWPEDRREWGERILGTLLARAQVVADVFHGRWAAGLPAREAKAILQAVRALPQPPLYLVGHGVLEPLAAGSSRVRADKKTRGLVMVVDVGAGTTDFALFYVRRLENGQWRAWHVKGATQAIRQAGDTVDNILRKVILEAAGVDASDMDFRFIDADLQQRIRQLKERLFRDGELTDRLQNDSAIRVVLKEFVEREEMKKFGEGLTATFQRVLEAADRSFFERLAEAGLTVVLTGGGATMPVAQELAKGQSRVHGYTLAHYQAALIPGFLSEEYPELAPEYLQLAVAMGGALPDLMEEMASLPEMPGASKLGWRLGGYYTKGV